MVTIVDHIGHSDKNGKPMGHPIKVINETMDLLLSITDGEVAVPKSHIPEIKNKEKLSVIELPNHINVFSTNKKGNFKKKWENIRRLFQTKHGIKWFINVDFSLFLYLFIFGFKKKKVWITLYYNPLKVVTGWRKYVINTVLKKINLIIITNKNFFKSVPGNKIFIPDYYYKEDLYSKHKIANKKNQMVCLGTMGETKQLEDFIDAAKELDMPIIIKGNFTHNHERYEQLKKHAGEFSNITIENKYVGNNEYYSLIAESKFVALPYDMNLYDERTSGILLETMFLGGIPVAPQKLLEYNSVNGVGYDNLEELPHMISNCFDEKKIISDNEYLIASVFSYNSIYRLLKEQLI